MHNFYHEYFFIPKHGAGKMREKAFLARMVASICFIVVCLFAMGITAYAWFSGSIVSSSNIITSAHYDLNWTVTVTNADSTKQTSVNTAIVLHADKAPQTYRVVIQESPKTTAKTGFCVIRVDLGSDGTVDQTYHTVQIGKDVYAPGQRRTELAFDMTLNQSATVTFTPHWGTSKDYRYAEGEFYITGEAPIVLGVEQTPPSPANGSSSKPGNTPPEASSASTTSTAPKTSSSTAATTTTVSTATTEAPPTTEPPASTTEAAPEETSSLTPSETKSQSADEVPTEPITETTEPD